MTESPDFAAVDIASLTSVPLLTTEGYVSLSKSLLAACPEELPALAELARKNLESSLARAEAALVARLGGQSRAGLERTFDVLVDRLWLGVRGFLELWLLYRHEGVKLLDEAERDEIELEACRELADAAEGLLDHLFGADKARFLRRPYHEQAAEMAARLRYVDDNELDEIFAQLVGPRLALFLRVCQRRYEAMVEARAAREGANQPNLREVRDDLRRNISLYSGVIAALLYTDLPDAEALVRKALMPNVQFQSRRSPSEGGEDEAELGEGEGAPEGDTVDFESDEGDSDLEQAEAVPAE